MELGDYFRFFIALIFVIGLIALLALMARRGGLGFPMKAMRPGGAGRRVEVLEVTPLDGRRRLVLIRRDDVEHLVIVSPTSELVVESGIRTGATAADFRAALTQQVNDREPPE